MQHEHTFLTCGCVSRSARRLRSAMLVYVAIIACNVSVYLCYFKKSSAKIREFGITAKRNSFFFEKRRILLSTSNNGSKENAGKEHLEDMAHGKGWSTWEELSENFIKGIIDSGVTAIFIFQNLLFLLQSFQKALPKYSILYHEPYPQDVLFLHFLLHISSS